jgi:hypothetical protein
VRKNTARTFPLITHGKYPDTLTQYYDFCIGFLD